MQIKKWEPATSLATKHHHVFAVDVSGSMYSELPKMRTYLKNNLATIVADGDIVSILYFSGNGQCGIVFEALPIGNLTQLTAAQAAIDKYLHTIGLTGFKEPLALAAELAKRQPSFANSLIFMSDGYDNTCKKSDVITNCQNIQPLFDSIVFMEYGWYADRDMLINMAEQSGGQHVFVKDHEFYVTEFENAIANGTTTFNVYEVAPTVVNVVYLNNETRKVVVLTPVLGTVKLPAWVSEVYELENFDITSAMSDDELYLCMYLAALRGDSDKIWETHSMLGDVRLIELYNNCFTKQELTEYAAIVGKCVFNVTERFLKGVNKNLVPDDEAFTIIDLCRLLTKGDNFLQIGHKDFKYNRIGTASEQVEEVDEFGDSFTPKFVVDNVDGLVALNAIVMNETRPNISINTVQDGYVGIPSDLAAEHNVPTKIDTIQYRNYTLVRDGIVNLEKLPVVLDEDTYDEFMAYANDEGLSFESHPKYPNRMVIDLTSLPLINRSMIKGIEAVDFFNMVLKLQDQKAKQKVLKFFTEQNFGKQNAAGLGEKYGSVASEWLSSIGIRDYGFAPKVSKVKADDFYMSRELEVKIKGLSTLPSIEAVNKKVDGNKKLNIADILIKKHLDALNTAMVELDGFDALKTYLLDETKKAVKSTREQMEVLNKLTYGLVLGKKWFTDCEDLDDGTRTIKYEGVDVVVSAAVVSKQISV